jgi:hypothetical protein
MKLTNDSTRVATQFYYAGQPVSIVRRGRDNVRIKRSDGEVLLVPTSAITDSPLPGGDINLGDPIENVASQLELHRSNFKLNFIALVLNDKEGYMFARDRHGMPYGPGRYNEIKTMDQVNRLAERLKKGGSFKHVRTGIYRHP